MVAYVVRLRVGSSAIVNEPKYPNFTQGDFVAFMKYATTMLRVQQFELALKQLATLYVQTPEDATFEKAWKDVQKLLTTAVGPLTDHLTKHGMVPQELLEELRKAAQGRNYLAHEYMLSYALKKNLGSVDPDDEIALLDEAQDYYFELEDRKEESRRKDHIIMTLAQRLPELEPAQGARNGDERVPVAPDRAESRLPTEGAQEGAEPRSWWRRWFGG